MFVRKPIKSVEITMKINKQFCRAEALADNVMPALDAAIDIMEGQIRKHKTRMVKNAGLAYMNEFLKHGCRSCRVR